MPTLRFARADELPPEERAALELLAKRMGSTPDQLAEIWRAQFHWPALAEANFQQVRQGFRSTQGTLPTLTKEAMHVAVSMANRCEYWLSSHTAAVLRLGISERGVTEIMAVAEHVAGLTAAAEGLFLAPDVPAAAADARPGLVGAADETAPQAAETLAKVRAWAAEALGVDGVPAFWRVLAHRPGLLAATWAKDRLVLGAGEIDAATKACAGLAVAMFRQSRYWSAYLGQLARRQAGLDDGGLVELAGCVLHYVSYNTIAHGMRLDAPYHWAPYPFYYMDLRAYNLSFVK